MPLSREPDEQAKPTSPSGGTPAPSNPSERAKDDLLRHLSDVEPRFKGIEQMGQDIARAARLARDVAGDARIFFHVLPAEQLSAEEWHRQTEGWRTLNSLGTEFEKSVTPAANMLLALAAGATSTSTGVMSAVVYGPDIPPQAGEAAVRVWKTLERFPLADQARVSIERLGLHARTFTNRSALEHLNDALSALEHPPSPGSDSPMAVLVALRECVERVLTELMRRRPNPEGTGKKAENKVLSITKQCGRAGLPPSHFATVAENIRVLLHTLSEAKQRVIPRDEIKRRFNDGLLTLNALMDSVDESQLRAP
jgi:hypothetical protein